MGVYIKGMEMPKNCLTCACSGSEYGECVLDPEKRWPEDYGQRADWCPLVPVPPHGRLIDADAFDERIRQAGGMCEEELTEDFKDGVQTVLAMLKTQTTIIPAEEATK